MESQKMDSHAPLLGEHNEHVFKDIIGMTPDEIAGLEREGITGTVPTGETP